MRLCKTPLPALINPCVKDLTELYLQQHFRTDAPYPPRFTEHHYDHPFPIDYDSDGLVVVANVPPFHIYHSNHPDFLRHRWICVVCSMPDAGRDLESVDQGHWAERARMGAEKWVGASEWPAGSDSSFWNALLVYGGEEGEYLVWHYLIARVFLGDK